MRNIVLLVLASFLLAGCGGVHVREVTEKKGYDGGVLFYRPVPYLHVTIVQVGDKPPDVQTKIVYLPDTTRQYVAEFHPALFGTMEGGITLADGWNLTGVNQKQTSGFNTALDSVTNMAKTLAAPAVATKEKTTIRIALYKYDMKNSAILPKPIELDLPQ